MPSKATTAAELRTSIKTRLQNEGNWETFWKFRDTVVVYWPEVAGDKVLAQRLSLQWFPDPQGYTEITDLSVAELEIVKARKAAGIMPKLYRSKKSDAPPAERIAENIEAAKAETNVVEKIDDEWVSLAMLVGFERNADEATVVNWVMDRIVAPPVGQIDPASVPNAKAVGMLKWARLNSGNYGSLLSQAWVKLLPTKQQIEQQQYAKDDGRVLNLVDECLEAELWEEGEPVESISEEAA
jgi:hypothetical protein